MSAMPVNCDKVLKNQSLSASTDRRFAYWTHRRHLEHILAWAFIGIHAIWTMPTYGEDPSGHASVTPALIATNHLPQVDIVVADGAYGVAASNTPAPLAIIHGDRESTDWEIANILARYLKASTNADYIVRRESDAPTQPGAIYVGQTQRAQAMLVDLQIDNIDEDGFVLAIPDENHIVIYGGSSFGTEFAVYDFLERYVGVRWLFPGELGEHIPQRDSLQISPGVHQDEPKFLSRLFSGMHRADRGIEWMRRNRARLRVEFHHNISRIFTPSYGEQHPEMFPIIDGERYIPPQASMDNWHLCYSAEGSVEKSIQLLREFFEKHPQYKSISLGVSDAPEDKNCGCEICESRYTGKINSLGYPDRSDIYYDWSNKVVAGLREIYPDKYFGCLAYSGLTEPPSDLILNDHFVPYICFDRMLWANPERKANDQDITERWGDVAAELGWYDYIYGNGVSGNGYTAPRIYPHTMQEYLQYAYANKVRHYYAEAYPSEEWHEGPKFYIALKLLWNPDANVDDLLNDWCESAVGQEAAPYLKDYYSFWEDFWMHKVSQTDWFSYRSSIYLIFNTTGYLDALSVDDLERCSQWLALVEEKASGSKGKQRAVQIRKDFERRRTEELNYFAELNQLKSMAHLARDVRTLIEFDFEGGISGWIPFSSQNKGACRWKKNAGKHTRGVLEIDGATSIIGGSEKVKVQPNKAYRVSGWVKTDSPKPNTKIEVKLQWRDQDKEELKKHYIQKILDVKSGANWQRFSTVCTPPVLAGQEGHFLAIAFIVDDSDTTAWFDDISVTEIKFDQ